MALKKRLLGAGEMNRPVEFFEKNYAKSDSGEPIPGNPVSLGIRYVNRMDGSPGQEVEGQILGIGTTVFTLRYELSLAQKANVLIIRDIDGDWQVTGPMQLYDSRGRQMMFKCTKNGEA